VRPFWVATGPRGHSADGDVGWTEEFFAGMQEVRGLGVRVDGFALHYYTDFRQTNDDGAKFDAKGWYAVLHKGIHVEQVMHDHWRIMSKYDPEHRTKFVLDEWGNWYKGGTELGPPYILSQTITLRDALHTAMTFDVFHRNAEKMEMANVAQTINCLHSLFAAVEDKYARTPAYYAFEMYRPHMGADVVPMSVKVPELTAPIPEGSVKMVGLSGSASIRDKRLCVTLTNPSLEEAVKARIRLAGGGQIAEAQGTALTHESMAATNTFDKPDQVGVAKLAVEVGSGGAVVNIPPKAVVALQLRVS
jgi:alpha-N-arabinofuranosidase